MINEFFLGGKEKTRSIETSREEDTMIHWSCNNTSTVIPHHILLEGTITRWNYRRQPTRQYIYQIIDIGWFAYRKVQTQEERGAETNQTCLGWATQREIERDNFSVPLYKVFANLSLYNKTKTKTNNFCLIS